MAGGKVPVQQAAQRRDQVVCQVPQMFLRPGVSWWLADIQILSWLSGWVSELNLQVTLRLTNMEVHRPLKDYFPLGKGVGAHPCSLVPGIRFPSFVAF